MGYLWTLAHVHAGIITYIMFLLEILVNQSMFCRCNVLWDLYVYTCRFQGTHQVHEMKMFRQSSHTGHKQPTKDLHMLWCLCNYKGENTEKLFQVIKSLGKSWRFLFYACLWLGLYTVKYGRKWSTCIWCSNARYSFLYSQYLHVHVHNVGYTFVLGSKHQILRLVKSTRFTLLTMNITKFVMFFTLHLP